MLDFVKIRTTTKIKRKNGPDNATVTIFPEFIVAPSSDLMIRGASFYAVWDEDSGFWSNDPGKVVEIVDRALREKTEEFPSDVDLDVRYLRDFSSKKWTEFQSYCGSLPDNYIELDSSLTFSNQEVSKDDYVTKKLPYPLKSGSYEAYDELIGTIYDPLERMKLEWAVGSVIAGDSKDIQKFVVLYGSSGSGKSTFLNIVQKLFEGYYNIFEAKALTGSNNTFAMEMFRTNPLVSIQHDGDLSRIEDNTKLNSIVSHEEIVVNERYKHTYTASFKTFLFMGTNSPVKITDAKSGIVRRLIDVRPSGNLVSPDRYQVLMNQINFELGAIAMHCLDVYLDLGKGAYDSYRPTEMMGATNDFYNFVEDHYDIFVKDDGTTLSEAWAFYQKWAEDARVRYPMARRAVKEELKNYFKTFHERKLGPDGYHRNVYSGFEKDKFTYSSEFTLDEPIKSSTIMSFDAKVSIFDRECGDCPAQLATSEGTPMYKWANVKTVLKDIDTKELHYVKVPENHIVIDFDLKDEEGNKSLERNMRAASKWPTTYAELSRSQKGVHLHYIYDGDPTELASEYAENIEVKVFTGNSSLRRQLTRCNDEPISVLSSGLPLKKGGKKVIDFEGLKDEKHIRALIKKNLKKEIHPSTKCSIDFIDKILNDAYVSGMHYDVSDMKQAIANFAANSTNNALYCIKLVNKMPFHSKDVSEGTEWEHDTIVFFDVEVFPNLFVVVFKRRGKEAKAVKLINPTPTQIEELLRFKLIGFNNRRYDNHILYARWQGYTNEQLYDLSQRLIVKNSANATFREAYNLSYADIWDYNDNKQSLKKWEIQLGIHHQELGLPWDQPVDESMWEKVAEYCINDVAATEAVFEATQGAFNARQMLSALSGLKINDTTRQHATRIIFGNDKHPQDQFIYTDLSEMFPGYTFDAGQSYYMGELVGEGGYVYAEPGVYYNVPVEDIASMHPTSAIQMQIFGEKYTKKFEELCQARIAIKHGDFNKASKMLDGKLKPYLGSVDDADKLAHALKIVINSVYGFTKANFDCEFKDPRNVDNIVAKRGALFMINLKHEVQNRGFTVAHIKTDSIKIPGATQEILDFVVEYGKQYGYTFETEAIYKKMALVNDAVYIAQLEDGTWTATGKQFQVPYVFKTLFSHEDICFDDLCETMSVSSAEAIYLDLNESNPEEHNYHFIGKVGRFTPVIDGAGGGIMLSKFAPKKPGEEPKYSSTTGSKGYRWLESEMVKELGLEDMIDYSYYEKKAEEAKKAISQYMPFEDFIK